MNFLFKSLVVAVLGCSMAQVSAMQGKKQAGKKTVVKPGNSGNVGSFLRTKYCAEPVVADEKDIEKPGKEDKAGK